MSSIRPFRPGDESALGEICVRTAAAGADATGMLSDDDIWPAIFVWPYVARHPDTAFVVETDEGRVAGYIVCAPDTDAFETWFRTDWWPPFARRWARPAPRGDQGHPGSREPVDQEHADQEQADREHADQEQVDQEQVDQEQGLLAYAAARGGAANRYQAMGFPAYLHIDLLPNCRGRGGGDG
ncbi:GNAT family N-acetyltransferase [Microbacterium elymi]|uniref:GNAT family N-acetyltransferase n=1 Tax=Microbacterium elymi TaxID=2909587 RepID=UPI003F4983A9